MGEKINIEVEVIDWIGQSLKVGQYFRYKEVVYIFEGYDYGTYPIGRDIKTNKQVQLPHY